VVVLRICTSTTSKFFAANTFNTIIASTIETAERINIFLAHFARPVNQRKRTAILLFRTAPTHGFTNIIRTHRHLFLVKAVTAHEIFTKSTKKTISKVSLPQAIRTELHITSRTLKKCRRTFVEAVRIKAKRSSTNITGLNTLGTGQSTIATIVTALLLIRKTRIADKISTPACTMLIVAVAIVVFWATRLASVLIAHAAFVSVQLEDAILFVGIEFTSN